MRENIIDSIEHCPSCGRYYTDDDAGCQCQPVSDEIKQAQVEIMKAENDVERTL